MSRQYLNERWCVRCGRGDGPTPYLRKYLHKLVHNPNVHSDWFKETDLGIMDIGCGNGRNVKYLHSIGYKNNVAFDMCNDYGYKITLGEERIPLLDHTVDIILANYVLMFLNSKEQNQVIGELQRVAKKDCRIMVELYAAKDSFAKTEDAMVKMQKKLFNTIGWEAMLYSKGRFIAKRVT